MPTGIFAEIKLQEDRKWCNSLLVLFKNIKLPNERWQERHLLSWERGVKCRHKCHNNIKIFRKEIRWDVDWNNLT
jgi:hypothetical protein